MGQHLLATGNVRGKKEREREMEREMKENEWKKEMKKNERRELCLSHFPSQERRKRKN